MRATCVPPQAERSKSFDVDQPQRSLALRLLPQRQRRDLLRAGEPDRHRPVLPDDAVGFVLGARDLGRVELAREIDRRGLGAEMETLGPRAEQPIERGRQHVLAGVLLHVIEAPRPVDRPRARVAGGRRAIDHVQHPAVVGVDDVEDRAPASVPTSNGCPPDVG